MCWGKGADDNKNATRFDFRHEYGVNNFHEDIKHISHDVAVGHDHACALYSIEHYNSNSYPHIAYNHNVNPNPAQFTHINLGIKCWGANHYGQLKVPYEFHSWTNKVVSLQYYSCAINANVYMACWGDETHTLIPSDILK